MAAGFGYDGERIQLWLRHHLRVTHSRTREQASFINATPPDDEPIDSKLHCVRGEKGKLRVSNEEA